MEICLSVCHWVCLHFVNLKSRPFFTVNQFRKEAPHFLGEREKKILYPTKHLNIDKQECGKILLCDESHVHASEVSEGKTFSTNWTNICTFSFQWQKPGVEINLPPACEESTGLQKELTEEASAMDFSQHFFQHGLPWKYCQWNQQIRRRKPSWSR